MRTEELVKEIKKRMQLAENHKTEKFTEGYLMACEHIIDYIETMAKYE